MSTAADDCKGWKRKMYVQQGGTNSVTLAEIGGQNKVDQADQLYSTYSFDHWTCTNILALGSPTIISEYLCYLQGSPSLHLEE